MVILTAAGHGGDDPGARNPYTPGRDEKVINLEIDAEFYRLSQYNKHRVYRMRTGDTRLDLDAIAPAAKSVGADVVIEFHVNAEVPEVRGVTALCLPPGESTRSASFAGIAVRRISEATGMPPLPLLYRTWSRFLELRDRVHVLTESGFITNPDDEALLRQPRVITAIALAHLRAVHDFFGLPEPVVPGPAGGAAVLGLAIAGLGGGLLVAALSRRR